MNSKLYNWQAKRVAVISDTHGLYRPELDLFLAGCDLVIHAGDIGASVVGPIENHAIMVGVIGNTDFGNMQMRYPVQQLFLVNGFSFYLTHIPTENLPYVEERLDFVIFGHTHQPRYEVIEGTIFINPGSVGPKRGALPISVCQLTFDESKNVFEVEFLEF
ncbi:MAG: YfcE family phosphodiesterase [Lentisphaeria bacterium]|nr:YfcE family phosphodiesterase [Lentisphaeria bacterium]